MPKPIAEFEAEAAPFLFNQQLQSVHGSEERVEQDLRPSCQLCGAVPPV
jgi:hypothetical protein